MINTTPYYFLFIYLSLSLLHIIYKI